MRSNWDRQFFAALSLNEYPCCAEQLSRSTNGDEKLLAEMKTVFEEPVKVLR
ncbi:hypothetical protein M378DRAFT_162108 [Amanita muscaria Koide BX008]|uniref:Uncharacterized protein n=1 Tax=Amanita muscaria (strain Koide BX008) TaxID=946122 RepID=A0A0C2X9M0_AMAMK|nr:hypothetical protein M378DRAFT_162108 [Amanita muscaria Koide BX008]